MIRVKRDDEMLGRGNTAVCIDCTYITKRKRHKKFKGKTTAGHVTSIFGAYEIDLSTQKATGRAVLKVVEGELVKAVRKMVKKHIAPGALI